MPNRRKGVPGSFGAPLQELLPRLTVDAQLREAAMRMRRKTAHKQSDQKSVDENGCPIFLLNQTLYERAKK
ncbi:MAG: hypothetical protein ACJ8EY_09335 [Sphingomicrobium sp.]